ncbi:hypothetical protein CFP56_006318, partial [Quercus suber]
SSPVYYIAALGCCYCESCTQLGHGGIKFIISIYSNASVCTSTCNECRFKKIRSRRVTRCRCYSNPYALPPAMSVELGQSLEGSSDSVQVSGNVSALSPDNVMLIVESCVLTSFMVLFAYTRIIIYT